MRNAEHDDVLNVVAGRVLEEIRPRVYETMALHPSGSHWVVAWRGSLGACEVAADRVRDSLFFNPWPAAAVRVRLAQRRGA